MALFRIALAVVSRKDLVAPATQMPHVWGWDSAKGIAGNVVFLSLALERLIAIN